MAVDPDHMKTGISGGQSAQKATEEKVVSWKCKLKTYQMRWKHFSLTGPDNRLKVAKDIYSMITEEKTTAVAFECIKYLSEEQRKQVGELLEKHFIHNLSPEERKGAGFFIEFVKTISRGETPEDDLSLVLGSLKVIKTYGKFDQESAIAELAKTLLGGTKSDQEINEAIKSFVKKGYDINAKVGVIIKWDDAGNRKVSIHQGAYAKVKGQMLDEQTLLHIACFKGNVAAVKCLLQEKANPYIKSKKYERRPLELAPEANRKAIDKAIKDAGKAVLQPLVSLLESPNEPTKEEISSAIEQIPKHFINVKMEGGKTLLHIACDKGKLEAVKLLLKVDANAVNYRDENGNLPLHLACLKKNHNIVQALLRVRRSDQVDGENNDGETPLHIACKNGDIELAKLLMEAGFDPNIKNNEKITPKQLAESYPLLTEAIKKYDTIQEFNKELMVLFDVRGDDSIAKKAMILDRIKEAPSDFNINSPLPGGSTLLHLACEIGSKEAVEALLEAGADINSLDNNENTPLHNAFRYGRIEIVDILIKAKADPNKPNNMRVTPLHLACEQGNEDAVRALLAAKANINATDNKGNTPLHIACKNGYKDVVDILLKAGSDLRKSNNEGLIPLDLAFDYDDDEIAKALLNKDYTSIGYLKRVGEPAREILKNDKSLCKILKNNIILIKPNRPIVLAHLVEHPDIIKELVKNPDILQELVNNYEIYKENLIKQPDILREKLKQPALFGEVEVKR